MEKSERSQVLIALLLLGIACFSAMNVLELRAEEPRRAVVAMEMLWRGKWLTPTIHELPYYNKPPFFNWVLATFFYLLGSMEEWAVRLPSLLAFLATGAGLYTFSRRYLSPQIAILAAFFFLTFSDLLFYGSVNTGEMDLMLTFFLFVQMLCLFHFHQKHQWILMFVLSYLFAALNFLMKGIPAIVFQGFTLIGLLVISGEWKQLFNWKHGLGILTFWGLVGTYFLAYQTQQDGLGYLTNLFQESKQKSVVESNASAIAWHLLLFLPNTLSLLLPWSLIPLLLLRKANRINWLDNVWLRFALIFIACNIWIYWLSPSTFNRYLYPFFPFFALWLANAALQTSFSFRFWMNTVIVLLTIRIIFNFTVLVYQQNNSNQLVYRDLSKELIHVAQQERIFFTGVPVVSLPAISLFGTTFYQDTLFTPPTLPYQLPYYIGKTQQQPLTYHQEPVKGLFYLAYEDFALRQSVEIYYTFQEKWTNRQMVLVKFK